MGKKSIRNGILSATQVADILSVSLKTVHNWVNQGHLMAFRTPGRHLRFKKSDVREFMENMGFPSFSGSEIHDEYTCPQCGYRIQFPTAK